MEHEVKTLALTQIILEVFRLNGVLLDVGDKMTSPLGLTSARWQVLGAISMEGAPITVSQIGRRMGLSRQAVQRVVDDLNEHGFVCLTDNPHHKRAKLVGLNEKGIKSLEELDGIQSGWAGLIVGDLDGNALDELHTSIKLLRDRFEASRAQFDPKDE